MGLIEKIKKKDETARWCPFWFWLHERSKRDRRGARPENGLFPFGARAGAVLSFQQAKSVAAASGNNSAQACLVKNVSPIISIQQPMNNGVGVYLFTWAVVTNTATLTA